MHIDARKTLARMHPDAVQSEQRIARGKGPWSRRAIKMRDQSVQRTAINTPLVKVAEKDHRHGRFIETLQYLFDLNASFTRSQSQISASTAAMRSGASLPSRPTAPCTLYVAIRMPREGVDFAPGMSSIRTSCIDVMGSPRINTVRCAHVIASRSTRK